MQNVNTPLLCLLAICTWVSSPGQTNPRLDWGTYFGGAAGESSRDLTTDADGNVYIVGAASSTNSVATAGTHQSFLAGGSDAMLAKFDNDGVLQWSTYFGGSLNEFGQNIDIDEEGNLYITGITNSPDGIAFGSPAQPAFGGGNNDGFIAKFTNDGILLWASYFGGPQDEFANAVSVDPAGNVLLTGWTNSTTGIATAGAQQENFSGDQDAFLTKYNGNGAMLWSTYLGDTGFDIGLQVATDAGGNVLLSGWTSSTVNIATAGAHQSVYGGGTADAFLMLFSPDGLRQWGTYYGGAGDDYGDALRPDAAGNIYLAGPTSSPDAMATTGAHQATLAVGFDAFLVKFDAAGQRQWGTYYGGNRDDTAYGIAIGTGGSVHLTGFTNSDDGIATADAHQTSFAGGNWDAYLARFSADGVRQWGTYYGGVESDQAYGIGVDAASQVFVAGVTTSAEGMSTAAAHQPALGGPRDAMLARFSSCSDLNLSAASNSPICEGDTLLLTAAGDAASFSWTGPANFSSTEQNPIRPNVARALSGTYQLIAVNSDGCRDTTSVNVMINPPPGIVELDAPPLTCTDNTTTVSVEAAGNGLLEYSLDGTNYSPDNTFPDLTAGSYTLYVRDETTCVNRSNFLLNPADGPIVNRLEVVAPDCGVENGMILITAQGDQMPFEYSIDGGQTFQPTGEFTDLPGGNYPIVVRDQAGCITNASAGLADGGEPPVIDEVRIEQAACANDQNSITVSALSSSDQLLYSIDGEIFQSGNRFTDLLPGNYAVTVEDENGCTVTEAVTIPAIDVLTVAEIVVQAADCRGNSGRIEVTARGGAGALRYELDTLTQSSPVFSSLAPGTYQLTVSDGSGCTLREQVRVSSGDCPIFIANAFSPNGDGVNDRFSVSAASGIDGQVVRFLIFNRWGNLVYEAGTHALGDTDHGWDGTIHGRAAAMGAYVYYLVIELNGGEKIVERGEVNLMR